MMLRLANVGQGRSGYGVASQHVAHCGVPREMTRESFSARNLVQGFYQRHLSDKPPQPYLEVL